MEGHYGQSHCFSKNKLLLHKISKVHLDVPQHFLKFYWQIKQQQKMLCFWWGKGTTYQHFLPTVKHGGGRIMISDSFAVLRPWSALYLLIPSLVLHHCIERYRNSVQYCLARADTEMHKNKNGNQYNSTTTLSHGRPVWFQCKFDNPDKRLTFCNLPSVSL